MVLLHRVSKVVEPKLLEAQCDFCFGRSTTDAMFVLRQLVSMAELTDNTELHMAFIDPTKAYDWVNMDALWRILRIYNVATPL